MKRILIITDDFNEMTFLETLLKKIGFDTLGIQSANQAQEQAMIMNPDMLILAETLRGQSSHTLLENIMGFRPNMFVLLLKKDVNAPSRHVPEFVNKAIKTPIDPLDLIRSICGVAKLKEDQFIEKYSKLGLFKGDMVNDSIKVTGKVDSRIDNKFVRGTTVSQAQEQTRHSRFETVVSAVPEPQSKNFEHKKAVSEVKEFRARENDPEIVKIDEQRKSFVRALFAKR
jgi:hypothetical protein